MAECHLPPNLDELVSYQPLPHLLWRIGEWQALCRIEMCPPILDLGCGDGWFGRMLYRDEAACGVDWSRQNARQAGQLGVYRHTLVADTAQLPFRSGVWNTIVANSTLEHVVELDATLTEARRVLQPGGHLYVTVPSEHFTGLLLHTRWLSYIRMHKLAAAYGRWLNRQLDHFHCWNVESWRSSLAKAGLELLSAEPLLPGAAIAMWDGLLPAQFFLRRANRVLPWYRWLRRLRRAVLERWAAHLEMYPGEAGAVWLLVAQ
jgi:SAM-dependent methyltransferase